MLANLISASFALLGWFIATIVGQSASDAEKLALSHCCWRLFSTLRWWTCSRWCWSKHELVERHSPPALPRSCCCHHARPQGRRVHKRGVFVRSSRAWSSRLFVFPYLHSPCHYGSVSRAGTTWWQQTLHGRRRFFLKNACTVIRQLDAVELLSRARRASPIGHFVSPAGRTRLESAWPRRGLSCLARPRRGWPEFGAQNTTSLNGRNNIDTRRGPFEFHQLHRIRRAVLLLP